MTNQYPSPFIRSSPRKLAFLIDCVQGLNSAALFSRFIDNFPANSDVFLFYPRDEAGMNRRLQRLESSNHGVFFFPTSNPDISCNLSFLLGQIYDKYDEFHLIVHSHPSYEDLCEQLLQTNTLLRNHIQVRAFEHLNEFEQFLKEMIRLQNESDRQKAKPNHKTTINYSKKHLFHACPFESRDESSILYRFGELLHHLDTQHPDVHYDYCKECQQLVDNHDSNEVHTFEEHIREKHWESNGFHLNIRSM